MYFLRGLLMSFLSKYIRELNRSTAVRIQLVLALLDLSDIFILCFAGINDFVSGHFEIIFSNLAGVL